MIYCYPKLPRYGLGNKLFEWARCRVFSHLHKIPMLAPVWIQVPAGLFIGEFKKKFYLRTFYLNLFRRGEGDISGIHWLKLQCFADKLSEPGDITQIPQIQKNGDAIFVFKRWEPNPFPQRRFAPLFGWSQFLGSELKKIIRPQLLKSTKYPVGKSIGVHVRFELHQFGVVKTADYLEWFVRTIQRIRQIGQEIFPVYITSDCGPRELAPLLREPNSYYIRDNAISDLLTLSKTSILLVTDFSSFGAWASYLGQMPTLCHPQAKYRGLYFNEDFELRNEYKRYIGPFDPDIPEQQVVDYLLRG